MELLFRWAIGDSNTQSQSKYSANGFCEFMNMAKTSILSFQTRFPQAEFVVIYNGDSFSYFKESFHRSSPSLPYPVRIEDKSEFECYLPFKPPTGVWWKWIPFRLDSSKTEVYVDTDVICFSDPQAFINQLALPQSMVLVSDMMPYFHQDVVGSFCKEDLFVGRIPINCGFLALKPGVDFQDMFAEAAKKVDFPAGTHSHFLDEQGCFNWAVYKYDKPFSLLPRDVVVYGPELADRLDRGIAVEICHFIASSKTIFRTIEGKLFRKIYDRNYTLDDCFNDIRDMISFKAYNSMVRALHFSKF